MADPDDERPASDLPQDLIKERETFVRSFLKKGVEYTELLIDENQELRRELLALKSDNTRLRSHLASDDAIRDLVKTIEKLESERRELLAGLSELERTEKEHEGRQAEIEQEVNDLANLYIANFQLHAGLSPRRVVRHLCDMMGQFVGADAFAIYLVDEGAKQIVLAASENLTAPPQTIDVGAGPIGEACMTGIRRVREERLHEGSLDDPVAILPIVVEGRAVGAIAIARLLEQKREWVSVDHELFELVHAQAGVALIASNLYATQSAPGQALRGFVDKLNKTGEREDANG